MFVILAERRDDFVGLWPQEAILDVLVDVIFLGDGLK